MTVVLPIQRTAIITIDVFYYLPDYKNIIQEFIWQTPDTIPDLIRVHKFLNYWHTDIEAVIQQILVSGLDPDSGHSLRNVDSVYLI